jgi:hypothetical protein
MMDQVGELLLLLGEWLARAVASQPRKQKIEERQSLAFDTASEACPIISISWRNS